MRWLFTVFLLVFSTVTKAEILIGVAGPMTGTSAAYGTQMVQGVQAAVDQLNSTGGVEGELLEIITADDACDNRKAEIAAENLVQKNVSVVIGHYCSNPSLAAAKIYEAAGIPMIAPVASLPALTDAGLSNVIRLVARDDTQGRYAANRMKIDYAADRIAVVGDGTPASELLLVQFGAASTLSFTIKPEARTVDDLIAALAAKNISALYCACAALDAGFIAAQISAANLSIQIFGPDSLLVPQFWEKAGDAGEGTFVSFAVDPQATAPARKLAQQFAKDEISADGPTLPAYAAMQIYADAAEKIATVKDAIDFINSNG